MTKLRREQMLAREAKMRERVALRKLQSEVSCFRCGCKTGRMIQNSPRDRRVFYCARPQCNHVFREDPDALNRRMVPCAIEPNQHGIRTDIYEVYVAEIHRRHLYARNQLC